MEASDERYSDNSASGAAMVMARVIIGVISTLVAGFFGGPAVGGGVAVIFGVWVLLGIGSSVANADVKPTEHKVRVVGSVAHIVVGEEVATPARALRGQASMIECPSCSELISPSETECPACGWHVPEQARGAMRELPPARAASAATTQASEPRPCPACTRCRAPTVWVEEFERFLCERCQLYA